VKRALAIAMAVALLAGCRSTSRPDATTTGIAPSNSTGSVTTSPSTSAAPASTATPALDTTGDDLPRVLAALDALLGRAYAQPDLAILDSIYVAEAAQRKDVETQLRYLIDNRFHYDDEGSTIRDITVVDRSIQGLAVLEAVTSHGPQVIKDAAGNVVKTGAGWAPRRERYGLQLGTDGRWRIRDNSVMGPA
jgi:hypothetical protein